MASDYWPDQFFDDLYKAKQRKALAAHRKQEPSKMVTLPLDAGGGWHLFTFDYMTQDGMFSGYLHALDMGHAEQMLSELKATAVLVGEMIEVSHDNP